MAHIQTKGTWTWQG